MCIQRGVFRTARSTYVCSEIFHTVRFILLFIVLLTNVAIFVEKSLNLLYQLVAYETILPAFNPPLRPGDKQSRVCTDHDRRSQDRPLGKNPQKRSPPHDGRCTELFQPRPLPCRACRDPQGAQYPRIRRRHTRIGRLVQRFVDRNFGRRQLDRSGRHAFPASHLYQTALYHRNQVRCQVRLQPDEYRSRRRRRLYDQRGHLV